MRLRGRKLKLPNYERAYVPFEKLQKYLLDEEHADGGNKAHFLRRIGFEIRDAHILTDQLLEISEREEVVRSVATSFGTKYVLDGLIRGPLGDARLRTVWFVTVDDLRPRLVTAYPISSIRRKPDD